jgi:hypothetical protein
VAHVICAAQSSPLPGPANHEPGRRTHDPYDAPVFIITSVGPRSVGGTSLDRCWGCMWETGFPTTCDDKGVTDQDSCTSMCNPSGNNTKAKGVWLGNGNGVCTCTGCLFCNTCANPKPDPDAEGESASLCVCVWVLGVSGFGADANPSA